MLLNSQDLAEIIRYIGLLTLPGHIAMDVVAVKERIGAKEYGFVGDVQIRLSI